MKFFCFFLVVVLLQVIVVISVLVVDDLLQIKLVGVFCVGIEGIYVLFMYYDEMGKLIGFDVDIVIVIVQCFGVKLQFVEGKWDGLIVGFDVNCYDVVVNEVLIIDVCKVKYDFLMLYIMLYVVLIVCVDNMMICLFDDLKGKKFVNMLISNFGKFVVVYGVDVVLVQGFNELIDLLMLGCVDVMINDLLLYFDFCKYKFDVKLKIVVIDQIGVGDVFGVLLCKGSLVLVVVIDKVFVDIKVDGIYVKILQKYFGCDVLQL